MYLLPLSPVFSFFLRFFGLTKAQKFFLTCSWVAGNPLRTSPVMLTVPIHFLSTSSAFQCHDKFCLALPLRYKPQWLGACESLHRFFMPTELCFQLHPQIPPPANRTASFGSVTQERWVEEIKDQNYEDDIRYARWKSNSSLPNLSIRGFHHCSIMQWAHGCVAALPACLILFLMLTQTAATCLCPCLH